jgi:hypothetical protein
MEGNRADLPLKDSFPGQNLQPALIEIRLKWYSFLSVMGSQTTPGTQSGYATRLSLKDLKV